MSDPALTARRRLAVALRLIYPPTDDPAVWAAQEAKRQVTPVGAPCIHQLPARLALSAWGGLNGTDPKASYVVIERSS